MNKKELKLGAWDDDDYYRELTGWWRGMSGEWDEMRWDESER